MAQFCGRVESEADVSAARPAVWAALTDPSLLPKLTPLLSGIDADGEIWTWHMMRISALGVGISPSFTERMTFREPDLIEYSHQPPAGRHERSGAAGRYELTEIDGGTHLAISLALTVELPLPSRAAGAVERVMRRTMDRTGERFSANLLEHLGAHEL